MPTSQLVVKVNENFKEFTLKADFSICYPVFAATPKLIAIIANKL